MTTGVTEPRRLSEIAREIRNDWKNPNYGAVPYLRAMSQLDLLSDYFHLDSATSVVEYFLANASTWRGDVAKRVKAELRGMLEAQRRQARPAAR